MCFLLLHPLGIMKSIHARGQIHRKTIRVRKALDTSVIGRAATAVTAERLWFRAQVYLWSISHLSHICRCILHFLLLEPVTLAGQSNGFT